MKRDLLKQMKNEWSENIWLVLELLIVMVAIWYLCWQLYSTYRIYTLPMGFNAEDVYLMKFKDVNSESPEFIDFGDEENIKRGEDMVALLNRIRKNPNVEAAGFSNNGLPYQFSYFGTDVRLQEEDSIQFKINLRMVSPEIAKVLKYESMDGKTLDELESLLAKGEVLLASYKSLERKRDPKAYLGTEIHLGGNPKPYTSHALIRNIRRYEFDGIREGTAIVPILEEDVLAGKAEVWEIAIRVKPGTGKAFVNEFLTTPEMQRSRNVYLAEPRLLLKNRDSATRTDMMEVRMQVGISICLMVMVLLGLIGTFWYRVRRRESEIAIRKVNGATSGDIFRRLLTEGILLLCISAILAIAVDIIYIFYGDPGAQSSQYLKSMIPGGIIAFVMLLVVVIIGIIIPARIAMNVKPAIALKDE